MVRIPLRRRVLGPPLIAFARRAQLAGHHYRRRTAFARYALLPATGRLHPVGDNGQAMVVDPRDSLGLAMDGHYEPDVVALMRDHLKPGDTFVDIGANIGWHSIVASSIVGDAGVVVAVEPELHNFRLLTTNLAINDCDNVVAVRSAAGATPGATRLNVSSGNHGGHSVSASGQQKTMLARVEDLMAAWQRTPNLIKIDTEGFEYDIVRGLTTTPPLIVEFSFDLPHAHEFLDLLRDRYAAVDEVVRVDDSYTLRPMSFAKAEQQAYVPVYAR
jgi:FkbM family methyltransferase